MRIDKRKKILVLGNGPSINNINFKLLDPSITTFGVNRIWLKHYPDYYFFHDRDILVELNRDKKLLANVMKNSTCFTSDWFTKSKMKKPNWLRIYSRTDRTAFVDSVTTGMRIMGRYMIDPHEYVFYIAGVHLKWMEPSHFWKSMEYDGLNKNDKNWYAPRFARTLKNFKTLQTLGFKMVSVTPNSKLNSIMRHENVHNLYKKG
jgi:hypothetical protein